MKQKTISMAAYLLAHRLLIAAFLLICAWCTAYFTTGNRIEWGDFSFFSQGYEAMRISVLEYGQFPWYNPWVSGGVPLYANPQFGLFSPQTIFVFLFGAPIGLKIALTLYTFAGFASMYLLLRQYFKIAHFFTILLSLIWIFGTFFVAHLPSHFTFVWYMLAPLFTYLSLTVRDVRSGLLLGIAFAVMALSQIHNPFVHISFICGVIIIVRLVRSRFNRQLLLSLGVALLSFILLAGHRIFFTLQNIAEFPRELSDLAPDLSSAMIAPFLPLSQIRPLSFMHYPQHPLIPHNFNEATSYIGIATYVAAGIGGLYAVYLYTTRKKKQPLDNTMVAMIVVFTLGLLCYLLALGDFGKLSPYNILKHLPVFSSMRVSTRWFIWFDLCVLLFIGLASIKMKKDAFLQVLLKTLLVIGVGELFILNVGYQAAILTHKPILSSTPISTHPFAQTSYFGQQRQLPDGTVIPDDGSMPDMYREYEATSYNLGVLYANDSLVQLQLDKRRSPGHPTCPFEEGCSLVKSKNATVTYWSPNKIILTRTAGGPIDMNMNNSSYFLINGKDNPSIKVAEPFKDFLITDTSKEIVIESNPNILTSTIAAVHYALTKHK